MTSPSSVGTPECSNSRAISAEVESVGAKTVVADHGSSAIGAGEELVEEDSTTTIFCQRLL